MSDADGPARAPIRVEHRGAIVVVTIDRDEVLNALDEAVRRELAATLRRVGAAPGVEAVVLTGEGRRAFCVGQDLREAHALDAAVGPRWMASWNDLYLAITSLPVPTVALVNGVAVGAGFQLGLLCDLRLASTAARMGLREIDVGLPAITGFWLLASMLGRSRATELILSGRLLDAGEALALGLVHEVLEPDALMDRGVSVARLLAARPRTAMARTRDHLQELFRPAFEDATAAAARDQVAAIMTGVPQGLMAGFLSRRRSDPPSVTPAAEAPRGG